jgi:F-type H+-transporting ATPase subunit gamma
VINKKVAEIISNIHGENKKIHLICVGAKLFNILKQKLNGDDVIELMEDFYKSDKLFDNSQKLAQKIISDFTCGSVDRVSAVYTRCYSAMHREVQTKDIIPLTCEPNPDKTDTVFEPNAEDVLRNIVPYNVAIQIYQAALESIAGEQGSRMISMDSATRNADELLSNLTIKYNRTRQYNITQELVEVVSGASAVAKG